MTTRITAQTVGLMVQVSLAEVTVEGDEKTRQLPCEIQTGEQAAFRVYVGGPKENGGEWEFVLGVKDSADGVVVAAKARPMEVWQPEQLELVGLDIGWTIKVSSLLTVKRES